MTMIIMMIKMIIFWGWQPPFLVSWIFILFYLGGTLDNIPDEEDESLHNFRCPCSSSHCNQCQLQSHQRLVLWSQSWRPLRPWPWQRRRKSQCLRMRYRIMLLSLYTYPCMHYIGIRGQKIQQSRKRGGRIRVHRRCTVILPLQVLLILIPLLQHLHHDCQRGDGNDDYDYHKDNVSP